MSSFADTVAGWFDDFRIAWAYADYERACRDEHLWLANSRFSTAALQAEIGRLKQQVSCRADELFQADTGCMERSLERLDARIARRNATFELLTRNYPALLHDSYEEKSRLVAVKRELYASVARAKDALSTAFAEKDSAHDYLNDCKERVDAWYEKSQRSPWLLGNAGRELPKHSLFGQSHGDLDDLKSDRDDAYQELQACYELVGELKAEIDGLYGDIDRTRSDIGAVVSDIRRLKRQRNQRSRLRRRGVDADAVRNAVAALQNERQRCLDERDRLLSARADFVEAKSSELGIPDMVQRVASMHAARGQFVASFDSPDSRAEREQAHRRKWLKAHGRARG